MHELLTTLQEIVRYGLHPDVQVADPARDLERSLVKLYDLYFDISFEPDDTTYPDFDSSLLPDIRANVSSNFKDYGFYKTFVSIEDVYRFDDYALADVIDDISDIIADLLEVQWRVQHNSLSDGLWFFQFSFRSHIRQHLLGVLSYMHQKNDAVQF